MTNRRLLPLLIFGTLWAVLLRHLSVHWALNPQYSFGWLVPFLAAFLLFQAWQERPEPAQPLNTRAAKWLAGLWALSILPTWLLEQPNPDWRLISWALGFEIILLSLCAVYWMGGKNWLRSFAFPICFILTAIPWPTGLELVLIQNLMRAVAWGTVELLGCFGIAALQHGNVIEVGTGMLGIDEACSGVRSLQSTFMAAIFLGHLYRCSLPRRFALIGIGIALALLCNLGRATFLAWEAARHGMDAIAKYHDPAGFTILTICFVLVWVAALLIAPAPSATRGPNRSPAGLPHPLPTRFMIGLALWLATVFLATEVWFRLHERGPREQLIFQWPESRANFRELDIPAQSVSYLKFDEGRACRWKESDMGIWHAFYFQWKAGPARSRILARSHRPEVCLPAGGFKLKEELGNLRFDLQGHEVAFSGYTFQRDEHMAYVFFCTWEDGHQGNARTQWSRFTGIDSVLRGERNLGQEVVEFILLDYFSAEEAIASMRAHLPGVLSVRQAM